jgi:hypothetical protein
MLGRKLVKMAVPFVGPHSVQEVGRAKVHPHRALQFGAPHFCEKRGARRGPASKPQSLAKKRSAISLEHAS